MFKLFSRSGKTTPDLSFIGADMHSHLLPGLDDGLQEVSQTMQFMSELEQLGYKKLICTPHILADLHPNSPETILPKLDLVRNELAKSGSKIKVEAAAEYMIDLEFERTIANRQKLLTFGKNYILVEMSYIAPSQNFEKVIFDLQMMDLQPILAHPERYGYFHNQFEQYETFVDRGCILQVNLLSLSGYYGKEVRKVAEKLIKKNMVQFLGTDMHHDKHLHMLKELASKKDFVEMAKGMELRNKSLL
jgi:tyrosine-protein phosphatase YwqE